MNAPLTEPDMNQIVRDLTLIAQSEKESPGEPSLPVGSRERSVAFLERLFVSLDCLHEYLTTARDIIAKELQRPFNSPWPYRDLLDEALIDAVLVQGPGALGDMELAKLLLNRLALRDLFDRINEADDLSEFWLERLAAEGARQRGFVQPATVATATWQSLDIAPSVALGKPAVKSDSSAAKTNVPPAIVWRQELNIPATDSQLALTGRAECSAAGELRILLTGTAMLQSRDRCQVIWQATDGTEVGHCEHIGTGLIVIRVNPGRSPQPEESLHLIVQRTAQPTTEFKLFWKK